MRRILASVCVVAAMLAGGCGDEKMDPKKNTVDIAKEAQKKKGKAPKLTNIATPPPAAPKAEQFEVEVRDDRVVGGPKRWKVDRGDKVVLAVKSDTSDEVHVHGYDKLKDVSPGETARLRFTADQGGAYEVELEDAGLQLGTLEVR